MALQSLCCDWLELMGVVVPQQLEGHRLPMPVLEELKRVLQQKKWANPPQSDIRNH